MNWIYLLSVVIAVVNNGAVPLAKSVTEHQPQGMAPPQQQQQQQLAQLRKEKQRLLAKLNTMQSKDAATSRIRKKAEEIRQVNEEIASIRQRVQQKPVPVVQPQPPNPSPESAKVAKEPKKKLNVSIQEQSQDILDSTKVGSQTNFHFGILPPSERILVPPQNLVVQDSQNDSTEPRPKRNSQLVPSEKNENFEQPAAAVNPEDINIPKTSETETVESQNSSTTPTEIETTKQDLSDDSNKKPVKETFEKTTTEKKTALNPLTISLGFIVVAAIVGVVGLVLYKKSKRNTAIARVTSLSIDHGITQHQWMNTIRHSQASPGDVKFQDMDNLITELNSPIRYSKYES